MDRERTREAIKVMQHWADGGCVEGRRRDDNTFWGECFNPAWEWMEFEYRIASNEPDESDIGKMVMVSNGEGCIYAPAILVGFIDDPPWRFVARMERDWKPEGWAKARRVKP